MTLPAINWYQIDAAGVFDLEGQETDETVEAMGVRVGDRVLLAVDIDPAFPASDAFLDVLEQINVAKAPMAKRDAIRIAHMAMRAGYSLGRSQLAGDENPFRWMKEKK